MGIVGRRMLSQRRLCVNTSLTTSGDLTAIMLSAMRSLCLTGTRCLNRPSLLRLCSQPSNKESEIPDAGHEIRNMRRKLTVPSLRMSEVDARSVMGTMKSSLVKYFGGRCFSRDLSQPDFVHLLLDPEKVQTSEDLGPRALRLLEEKKIPVEFVPREIELTFDNMPLKHVIAEYLKIPANLVSFGKTEKVGHVVIVELHDALLPYKETIGRIIIEKKKPDIRVVMNFQNTTERSNYRIFPMEVLAKETEDTTLVAEVEVMGCRFRLDFGKVFWNHRRNDEHEAVSRLVNPGDVMYDVFAGVGPFCIPAAKRGARVLANDFNPDCYHWLQENARLNDVESRFTCFAEDGHHFIKDIIRQDILKEWRKGNASQNFHIVMNLPLTSVQFLSAFQNWMANDADEVRSLDSITLPYVHLYSFSTNVPHVPNEERLREVQIKMAEYHLGPVDCIECRPITFLGNLRIYKTCFQLPSSVLGVDGISDKVRRIDK